VPQSEGGLSVARRLVCAGFVDTAERHRRDGLVSGYFWQCKEPALRLRLRCRGEADMVGGDLADQLRRLRRDGVVRRWSTSIYEPEVHLFGGPGASDAFHRHATVDSQVLARWSAQPMPFSSAVLSLASLNDLFVRALGGRREEIWDVWCRLAGIHGRVAPAQGVGITPVTLSTLADTRHRPAAALMRRMMRANATLADRLERLWARGALSCGQRATLACVALFHWNRLALPADTRVRLLDGMTARLNVHTPAGA
jgi:thiopeptide-type bacteriocin biosynthesis protein